MPTDRTVEKMCRDLLEIAGRSDCAVITISDPQKDSASELSEMANELTKIIESVRLPKSMEKRLDCKDRLLEWIEDPQRKPPGLAFTSGVERTIADCFCMLWKDAERYRKLRSNHWNDGPETLVVVRASDVPLGRQTYSDALLDDALDAKGE